MSKYIPTNEFVIFGDEVFKCVIRPKGTKCNFCDFVDEVYDKECGEHSCQGSMFILYDNISDESTNDN